MTDTKRLSPETGQQWSCSARRQSLPEPADCNWPFCGCDPGANKVIEAIEEATGWDVPDGVPPTELATLRARLAAAEAVIRPFAEMGDQLDDCENLVDDPDCREEVQLIFGGFTPGSMERAAFRAASAWIEKGEKAK